MGSEMCIRDSPYSYESKPATLDVVGGLSSLPTITYEVSTLNFSFQEFEACALAKFFFFYLYSHFFTSSFVDVDCDWVKNIG